MMHQQFHISEMDRRMANMIRVGTVKEVDYEKARVRVQIGKLCTDWIPWVTGHASTACSWSPPPKDEQVVVLSPCGDMGQGIVLPALYQQAYPAPSNKDNDIVLAFQDGTLLKYDTAAHELSVVLAPEGKLNLTVSTASLVMTPDSITLKAPMVRINNKTFVGT